MIVTDVNQLKDVEDFIARSQLLAFDIETTGLNTRNDNIIGFGISDGETSYYIAHLAWDGEKLVELIPRAACANLLRRLLSSLLVTFNGAFDLNFCFNYFDIDLLPSLYSDAMLAAHTSNENGGPFKLKSLAAREFGVDSKAEQAELKASLKAAGAGPKEFYKAELDILARYCMQDCVLTLKLHKLYTERMEGDLLDFYLEREVMPLYREVTIPMERKGIPVDVPELRRAHFEIKKELDRLESEILVTLAPMLGQFNRKYLNKLYPVKAGGKFAQVAAKMLRVELPLTKSGAFSFAKKAIESLPSWHMFRQFMEGRSELPQSLVHKIQLELNNGEPELNLASKDQLRYVFFTILKEKPTSFTDKGVPQVNEEFLASVQHKYEFGPKLLEYNKLSKICSSYIERFLEEQEDGMFYPRFQQHRTTTGRYGGDLQQLPRALEPEDETSAIVRNFTNRVRQFFIAGDGYKLVDADYNSLEVVVFADDAGDESLLDMIKRNEDFYSKVALQVHKLEDKYSADKKASNFLKIHKPKLRQDAKVYGLGIRYGMGDWKLSITLDISTDEAADIIQDYLLAYPKLKQKMDFYLKEAKTKGQVVSKGGRIRHLPEAKEIYERYGDEILDVRAIYRKYPKEEVPAMKKIRRKYNHMLNSALNHAIQSFAATIVNRASVALARELKAQDLSAYICINVHDELCVRAPEAEVETIIPIMQKIMETTTILDAPLTAVPEVAYTYGDVK